MVYIIDMYLKNTTDFLKMLARGQLGVTTTKKNPVITDV